MPTLFEMLLRYQNHHQYQLDIRTKYGTLDKIKTRTPTWTHYYSCRITGILQSVSQNVFQCYYHHQRKNSIGRIRNFHRYQRIGLKRARH